MPPPLTPHRVGFLFKAGRTERLHLDGPTEFFYGIPELEAVGWNIEIINNHDLGLSSPPASLFWRIAGRLSHAVVGLSAWVLNELAQPIRLELLNKFDVLVATTNTFGLAIGALKRLGMLRARVVFLTMGLVEESSPAPWRAFYRWVLKDVEVYALAEPDAQVMTILLRRPVGIFHFGIDTDFWHPSEVRETPEEFVLSIGNDRHRDFDLLIRAWKPEYPQLNIVTKLPVAKHGDNVKVIQGDWYTQALSDTEIRALYQQARFIVLPMRNTYQPSGQSSCLQAMACGRAIAITDFPGLWNRESMRDGDTCVLVGPPGSVEGIQAGVERLLHSPVWTDEIGARARCMVEARFHVGVMASAMAVALSEDCNLSMRPQH